VGGYCLEGLARAGVGRFILVDFDIIRPTNLNRQLLATETSLDLPKVEAARERVAGINPAAQVQIFRTFVDQETLPQLIALKPDMLIDAIDSLGPKIHLLNAVHKSGIPVISSMGAATRTDPSRIRIADLLDTKICPLASRIRRRLKKDGIGRGIICVYSEELQDVHALSADPSFEPGDLERGRPRRRLGSLSTITGIFGLTIANYVIFRLIGKI
jgi:tRNA A37 threonylcarbamoyladenosine dehydratase